MANRNESRWTWKGLRSLIQCNNHKIGTLNSYPRIGELTYCMANSLGKVKYTKLDRYPWDRFTNIDVYVFPGCLWS